MATSYLTPGVYVEELPSAGRPIAGVGTSVAAFVGFAEMGPRNKATLVTNWSQFKQKFGDIQKDYYLAHSVYGYFNNGGTIAYVVNISSPLAPKATVPSGADAAVSSLEVHAIREGLKTKDREGLPLKDISVDVTDGPDADAAPTAIVDPDGPPMFGIQVKRGDTVLEKFSNLVMDRESERHVETIVNGASQYIWLEVTNAKAPLAPSPAAGSFNVVKPDPATLQLETSAIQGDVRSRSGIAGLEAISEVTIVCAPDLMSAYQRGMIAEETLTGLQKAMVEHCELMQNRVAVLDAPPGLDPQEVKDWREKTLMVDSSYAALYYPWIRVMGPDGKLMSVPPSGHMAGVWARTDGTRGVHKAPANEVVRGAVQVAQDVTAGEQGLLNPKGINCIRSFGAMGIRAWGARTLAESDKSWQYINVRRFFNFVEASIQGGTNWAVFEPNDKSLWQRLKRDVGSFLMLQYRSGALFGDTPDQAFYVKCDAETNPPDVIDAGMVVTEIGMCPVKPAEFVIFRVAQLATGG